MITEWILAAGGWLLTTLAGALPTISVPSWLSGNDSAFSTVFSAAGSMGVWFPTTLVVAVLSGLLVIWLASFVVKVARMILSLFTAGGGSAA
jgi:hypothetical protein